MADPQTKILYFAKRDEWANVESEIETIKRSDFSMADNVSFFRCNSDKSVKFEILGFDPN